MKIEKMTEEQEGQLVEYREEIYQKGISCEPADFEKAESAITAMYTEIEKGNPYFWHVSSPLMACFVISYLKNNKDNLRANLGASLRANLMANLWANLKDNLWANLWDNLGDNLWDNLRANFGDNLGANLGDNLRDNLWDNLRDNLWDNLWANLWDNLGANLRANLWDNLRDNLWDNLGANLRANLGANLRANLWDNLRDNLWDNLGDNLGANLGDNLRDNLWDNLGASLRDNKIEYQGTDMWGQQDMYWVAFYEFPYLFLDIKYKDDELNKLTMWKEIGMSAMWWYPFEGICFICDRPQELNFDEQKRLHAEDRSAYLFRDGWNGYYWHGVSVPEYVVMRPEEITPKKITEEKNQEVKRVMMERYGWHKYLDNVSAKLIDKRLDPTNGKDLLLYEFKEDDVTYKVLKVVNGTPEQNGEFKEYGLRVPTDQDNALDAVIWTYPYIREMENSREFYSNMVRT